MMQFFRMLFVFFAILLGLPDAKAVTCSDASLVPSNPDSVYTVNSDGTVSDLRNGLMWQQCAEGLGGSNCSNGSPLAFNWQEALHLAATSSKAGYSDWRLPSPKELLSLVESCRYRPAINDAVFPGAPDYYFWSGSPTDYYGLSNYAWHVDFINGYVSASSRANGYYVRLVRGGNSYGSFDAFASNNPASPTITAITPTSARLDVPQQFTITGSNLTPGMGFTIEDCEPSNQEVGTGSSTQRTFQCTPRLPGAKHVTVKTAPGGTVLFTSASPATTGAVPIDVDHPARMGDVSARGVPTEHGVSLFNGNVHLSVTDLAVPGRGVSFALTRSYNSYDSTLEAGRGSVSNAAPWRFNWDLKLGYVAGTSSSNQQLWVQREDGSGENFFKEAGVWYPMDQGNFNTLQGDTPVAGQTTLLTREGLKYIFQNPDQNPDLGGLLIGVFDHDGNGLTITRDASQRVSRVTDAAGRNYSFTYDANSRLSRVTDFSGRYVEYTWETSTTPVGVRLRSVRDARGGVTTYNYTLKASTRNQNQNKPSNQYLLSSVIDPLGNTVRSFDYVDTVYGNWGASSVKDAYSTWNIAYCAKHTDSSDCIDPTAAVGFETTVTPPLGAVTIARFDSAGRLTEQVDSNNYTAKTTPMSMIGVASKNYNLAALPTQQQSALGFRYGYGASYEYTADKAGNLARRTDAENNSTQQLWSSDAALLAKNLHRKTTVTTATGASHGFAYTATGNVQRYTPPGLAATALTYDSTGQLTGVTDGRGNSVAREYDSYGNLTRVTDPDGSFIQNTYDSLGRLLTRRDKRGNLSTMSYDAAGNVLTVKDALNNTVSHVYDANGNRTRTTDALGNVTTYTYDANNRQKTINRVVSGQTLTTSFNYDDLGRVMFENNANQHADITSYDGEGNVLSRSKAHDASLVTRYEYDDDNRVIKVTDPEGRVTSTTYDKVGRVKTVTTAAGVTSYAYDGDGRMTRSTDPRGKTTQYSWDAAGRLTSLTDANNQVTRTTYDDNGNLLTVTDPGNHTTTHTYDKLNRLLTRTDANGQQWVNTYDENGNLRTSTAPGNRTTSFGYDALNRVTRIDYPDASTVAFILDANGNRLSMTDATGTTTYTYDALNRLNSVTDAQGKTLRYAYDGIGNVTTLTYPDGQPVRYSYDMNERLSSVTDWQGRSTAYTLNKAGQVTAALFGNGSRADMGYDMAGRLISLINKAADGSVISSHVMTLDGNGNIVNAVTQLPLEPSIVAGNRSLSYDSANRLATYQGSAVTHDAAGRITGLAGASYAYNDRDQITGVSGSQTASYTYNGDGHRLGSTVNGQVRRFVIDPNRSLPEVLAETDAAGAIQRRYVYGYGLVAQIDSANTPSYYHFDPTGSTLALTNASGVVTDKYAYTPYGETTASGATVNPFRYVGKLGVMDDGNGLHYMRARYYRQDVARFMSLDQLVGEVNNPQSLNRYAYVLGNPVMGVDPSGLESQDEWYSKWKETAKGVIKSASLGMKDVPKAISKAAQDWLQKADVAISSFRGMGKLLSASDINWAYLKMCDSIKNARQNNKSGNNGRSASDMEIKCMENHQKFQNLAFRNLGSELLSMLKDIFKFAVSVASPAADWALTINDVIEENQNNLKDKKK